MTGLQPGDRVQCSSSARATGPAEHLPDRWRLGLQLDQTRFEVTARDEIELIDASRWALTSTASADEQDREEAHAADHTVQWLSSYRAAGSHRSIPTDTGDGIDCETTSD
ncbi:MAG: hypothetical protein R3C56_06850 [Pirellulaceae bacterium]